MAVMSKILTFPTLTLAACIEGFFAIKLFPNYYSSSSHLAVVAFVLLINYAFGVVFWVFLYPVLFSPLRRIPGPKVSFVGGCSRCETFTKFSDRRTLVPLTSLSSSKEDHQAISS
jgi:hypothetical protein